ncbi:hypothetical protein MXB02_17375 [Pseudomonas mosselii]|uniref:hypothetical protein n=1 Tax=Pseudomonas mosselii TaxID=78327 RepID=UPI001FF709BD|nr:hypothetical protein [Pseudomonas mosselii]UPF02348.1 hypothetical protein MXB02_17375 [Pseudomonas mosselii]
MSTHRHHCPVSDAEHSAAAWLGQAGLYRTRLEAVQNGEQYLEPVFELARSRVCEGHSRALPQKEKHL